MTLQIDRSLYCVAMDVRPGFREQTMKHAIITSLLIGLLAGDAQCALAQGGASGSAGSNAAAHTTTATHPFNRVVIIVDRSDSFHRQLADAHDLAWKYIRNLANTSPRDEVYVIGVDHEPSLVTFVRGVRSRRDAQQKFDAAFARTSGGSGTDWKSGFQKASECFSVPPAPATMHLLVFGDLIADPRKDRLTHRLIQAFTPVDKLDWSIFSGVRCTMYFVNDSVRGKLLASPAFRSLGAAVYSIESAAMAKEIETPRPAANLVYGGDFGSLLLFGALLVLAVGFLFWAARRPARGTRR